MNNCEKAVGPCVRCGKTLRAVGDARANGANHNDWARRSLHKQYWKEERAEQAAAEHIKGVMDRLQNEPLAFGFNIGN